MHGNAVLHWLAFQRQGRFPCSVPLVLRACLFIVQQKYDLCLGLPLLALKRNVKRAFGLQTYTFPTTNQDSVSKAVSWGCLVACLLGCSWAASWVANPMLTQLRFQSLPGVHRQDALQQHETQKTQTTNPQKPYMKVCATPDSPCRVAFM